MMLHVFPSGWFRQEGEEADRTYGSTENAGAWLSLVERFVRDEEAAGSNPVAPRFPKIVNNFGDPNKLKRRCGVNACAPPTCKACGAPHFENL